MKIKLAFIAAIVSIVLFFVSFNYIRKCEEAETNYYEYMVKNAGDYISPSCEMCEVYTREPALITLAFFVFFEFFGVFLYVKAQNNSMKFMAGINVAIISAILLWDISIIQNIKGNSFAEIGPAWIIFSLLQLTFCVVVITYLVPNKKKIRSII